MGPLSVTLNFEGDSSFTVCLFSTNPWCIWGPCWLTGFPWGPWILVDSLRSVLSTILSIGWGWGLKLAGEVGWMILMEPGPLLEFELELGLGWGGPWLKKFLWGCIPWFSWGWTKMCEDFAVWGFCVFGIWKCCCWAPIGVICLLTPPKKGEGEKVFDWVIGVVDKLLIVAFLGSVGCCSWGFFTSSLRWCPC